ncbi:adhesion G protein-coupled receptor B2 [Trichonephila clavipes]|nr:adhesion G protein-coupled receptor B2 [Trichonephila clavipes]
MKLERNRVFVTSLFYRTSFFGHQSGLDSELVVGIIHCQIVSTNPGPSLDLTCRYLIRFETIPAYTPHVTVEILFPPIHGQTVEAQICLVHEDFWHWTATAGSDVVQSGRPIFDDFFQHLWPYIGNNTPNVVFQMVKRLWRIRIDQ